MAETLANFITNAVEGKPQHFSGEPWYNSVGDCIVYHWRDDEYYRDWMDDKLTVYRSTKDREAVGCQIKGVLALVKKFGEYGISLTDPKGVPLAIFLMASHFSVTATEENLLVREKMYRYIMGKIGNGRVSIPEPSEAAL